MTTKNRSDYDAHDMRTEKKAFAEDMDQEREDARAELQYLIRLSHAEFYGSLEGYDPHDPGSEIDYLPDLLPKA